MPFHDEFTYVMIVLARHLPFVFSSPSCILCNCFDFLRLSLMELVASTTIPGYCLMWKVKSGTNASRISYIEYPLGRFHNGNVSYDLEHALVDAPLNNNGTLVTLQACHVHRWKGPWFYSKSESIPQYLRASPPALSMSLWIIKLNV
jgi:hypothetical protein